MPQSTPERRDRWGVGTETAEDFLLSRGYLLLRDFHWRAPIGKEPTPEEWDAIHFLIEEWDYGGLAR